MITNVYVEVGQMVSPQVKAMAVIDDSGKKVKIQVADMDIDQLKTGMPMNVSLQSLGESCRERSPRYPQSAMLPQGCSQ